MDEKYLDQRLHEYLDGEMAPADRAAFENELKADAALAESLRVVERVRALLADLPWERIPKDFSSEMPKNAVPEEKIQDSAIPPGVITPEVSGAADALRKMKSPRSFSLERFSVAAVSVCLLLVLGAVCWQYIPGVDVIGTHMDVDTDKSPASAPENTEELLTETSLAEEMLAVDGEFAEDAEEADLAANDDLDDLSVELEELAREMVAADVFYDKNGENGEMLLESASVESHVEWKAAETLANSRRDSVRQGAADDEAGDGTRDFEPREKGAARVAAVAVPAAPAARDENHIYYAPAPGMTQPAASAALPAPSAAPAAAPAVKRGVSSAAPKTVPARETAGADRLLRESEEKQLESGSAEDDARSRHNESEKADGVAEAKKKQQRREMPVTKPTAGPGGEGFGGTAGARALGMPPETPKQERKRAEAEFLEKTQPAERGMLYAPPPVMENRVPVMEETQPATGVVEDADSSILGATTIMFGGVLRKAEESESEAPAESEMAAMAGKMRTPAVAVSGRSDEEGMPKKSLTGKTEDRVEAGGKPLRGAHAFAGQADSAGLLLDAQNTLGEENAPTDHLSGKSPVAETDSLPVTAEPAFTAGKVENTPSLDETAQPADEKVSRVAKIAESPVVAGTFSLNGVTADVSEGVLTHDSLDSAAELKTAEPKTAAEISLPLPTQRVIVQVAPAAGISLQTLQTEITSQLQTQRMRVRDLREMLSAWRSAGKIRDYQVSDISAAGPEMASSAKALLNTAAESPAVMAGRVQAVMAEDADADMGVTVPADAHFPVATPFPTADAEADSPSAAE